MKNDLLIVKTGVDSKMFSSIRGRVGSCLHKSENLLIIIQTCGGDPMYAYRSMIFLREIYKKIFCIVFDEAMSAGTLMSLGADGIYLDSGACLGPLDLQIPHPRDDSMISALDVRDTASSTVFEASTVMLGLCSKNLNFGLPMTIAVDASIKMASDLYRPIMDKIDPFHLHESYRNAELSTSYGTALLLGGMIKDEGRAAKISTHLANDYFYHGYAIMEEEARKIGLKIMNFSEISKFVNLGELKKFYDSVPAKNIVFVPVNSEVNKKLQMKIKKEGN